eukprot:TRINITY_DN734_c0_g1_i1.p1 TRINITY_DN734_c0_g1~~TRINITY_DN734_c0_g1_i1.p1  ORF type:complete len:526 (-),score=173.95 TRINITY_DN734_c0_g1_i1:138-1715(-)
MSSTDPTDIDIDPRESLQGEEVEIETGSYGVDGTTEEFVEEYVQEEEEELVEGGEGVEVELGVEEGLGEVEGDVEGEVEGGVEGGVDGEVEGEVEAGEDEGEGESEVSLTDSELALLDKNPSDDLELADEEEDNARLTFDPEASMGTLLGFPQDQVNEVLETEVAGTEGAEEIKSHDVDSLPSSGKPEEESPEEAVNEEPSSRQRADTFDMMLESGYAFSETDVDAILNDSPSKASPADELTPVPQPELAATQSPSETASPPQATDTASVSETGEGLYYNTNPDGTISLPTFTPEPETPAEVASPTPAAESPAQPEPLPFLPGEATAQRDTIVKHMEENYGTPVGDNTGAAQSGNVDDGAGVGGVGSGVSSSGSVGGGGGGEEFGSSDSPNTPLLSSTQEYTGGDLFQDNPPARKMSNRSRMEVMGGDVGSGGGGSSVSSRSDAEYYNMSEVSPPQMELKDDAWYDRKYIKFIAIGLALLFIILFIVFIAIARGRGGFIALAIICLVLALPFVGFAVYMFVVRRK